MTGLLSGQPAGATAIASAENASATEQNAQEQKGLSAEEYRAIAREEATRAAQSLVDKAEARISRKAQEQIAAIDLTRQTLGLTDEQVHQAKQQVIYNDLTTPRQQEQASTPQPARQVQAQTEIDPVIAETLEVFKTEGVTIETSDPEYKALDTILNDPNGNIHQYRKELFKQIDAKRQRVAANSQNAQARVVSGGQAQTNDGAPNASAREYLQRAHRK